MLSGNKMSKPYAIKRHFSPLRYPGGKGKLCSYIKSVIEANQLYDREYVELYAGGAGVAIELLAHEYVFSVHINDLSRPVYAVWDSVLNHTEDFCRLLRNTRITLKNWDKQRAIFVNEAEYSNLTLGFATFFLNRTNRSGLLNGGIIGGRRQEGEWGIDARYNVKDLLNRVQMIADFKDRIRLTSEDAYDLIAENRRKWAKDAFIYLDPPYYSKGKHLYYDFYQDDDHAAIAEILSELDDNAWVVSYDNHVRIRELFAGYQSVTYDIGYSAREHKVGSEVMFFSPSLVVPDPTRNMKNFVMNKAASA